VIARVEAVPALVTGANQLDDDEIDDLARRLHSTLRSLDKPSYVDLGELDGEDLQTTIRNRTGRLGESVQVYWISTREGIQVS